MAGGCQSQEEGSAVATRIPSRTDLIKEGKIKVKEKTNTAKPESESDITGPGSKLEGEPPIIEQGTTVPAVNINDIPFYSGDAAYIVNNNVPYFIDNELSAVSYEYYSDLDPFGRCGVCVASVGNDIMPTEERGEIGHIRPTGWQTVKYPEIIDGNYLYNRCHLIGFQLTGENANEKNLITGTRYMNMEGMLPFENMVADFVKETGYHVMYRVTPVFDGNNLLASGVLMEAKSVEDNGKGILFNVFCYNVQPGIIIDYATGNNAKDGTNINGETPAPEQIQEVDQEPQPPADASGNNNAYAVNNKNGKIHITGKCPATGNGSNAMNASKYFGTYEEAEAYSVQIVPSQDQRQCGNCWKY